MIADILAPPATAGAAFAPKNLRQNIVGASVVAKMGKAGVLGEGAPPGLVAKIGKAGVAGVGRPAVLVGKIPVVLLARSLRARLVDFATVKAGALIGIA